MLVNLEKNRKFAPLLAPENYPLREKFLLFGEPMFLFQKAEEYGKLLNIITFLDTPIEEQKLLQIELDSDPTQPNLFRWLFLFVTDEQYQNCSTLRGTVRELLLHPLDEQFIIMDQYLNQNKSVAYTLTVKELPISYIPKNIPLINYSLGVLSKEVVGNLLETIQQQPPPKKFITTPPQNLNRMLKNGSTFSR